MKAYSVVAWDGQIDASQWVVGVDERDDWDVDVRGLGDGLVVSDRVGDNDQTRLLEGTLDLIGERAWSETTGNWCSSWKIFQLKKLIILEQKKIEAWEKKIALFFCKCTDNYPSMNLHWQQFRLLHLSSGVIFQTSSSRTIL